VFKAISVGRWRGDTMRDKDGIVDQRAKEIRLKMANEENGNGK
jgi:hypothetical protein